ncbi:MAG TPA: methyltransferase domain-containing protein [Pyrinomonadaceae bacterium]|nr:methyltransferase domain-containing protein [Pyrinomonadaceae bacterium]
MTYAVGTHNEADREAWLRRVLKDIPSGASILDAGAGEQKFKSLCAHLKYTAQDFAQYDGRGDATGLQMGSWDQTKLDIVSDISAIPLPDESFDAIVCVEVLEHLPTPLLALKEFSRLLKKGGRLIVTAPFCSLTHFAPYHFYSGFSRYFYSTHFPAYGFEITEMQENGNYFEYLAQEVRRLPEIAGRYANDSPGWWDNLVLRKTLKMLERFTSKDRNSAELLHFGYHVVAIKRPAGS